MKLSEYAPGHFDHPQLKKKKGEGEWTRRRESGDRPSGRSPLGLYAEWRALAVDTSQAVGSTVLLPCSDSP